MTKILALAVLLLLNCASLGTPRGGQRPQDIDLMYLESFRGQVLPQAVVPVTINGKLIGTGFAIHPSYLLTAGHVCMRGSDSVAFDQGGIVAIDVTNDMCLIYAPDHGGFVLTVSPAPPRMGEHIWVYGFPAAQPGILTEGYAGYVVRDSQDENVLWQQLSCPAYFGNSGSPVLTDNGEVVGVLVAVISKYPQVSFASTHSALWSFLSDHVR